MTTDDHTVLERELAELLGVEYDDFLETLIYDGCAYRSVCTCDGSAMTLLQSLCRPAEEGGRGWWSALHVDHLRNSCDIYDANNDRLLGLRRKSLAHAITIAIVEAMKGKNDADNAR